MQYTPEQIYASYRQAANKSKQLGILAQLNACTISDIKAVIAKCEQSLKSREEEYQNIKSGEISRNRSENSYYELKDIIANSEHENVAHLRTTSTSNRKYTQYDHDAIKCCIASGMSSNQAAEKLGYNNLKIFRPVYYRIKKSMKLDGTSGAEYNRDVENASSVSDISRSAAYKIDCTSMQSQIVSIHEEIQSSLQDVQIVASQLENITAQLDSIQHSLTKYVRVIERLTNIANTSHK